MPELKPTRLSQEALTRILEVTAKLAAPFDLIHMLTEVVQSGESVLLAERGSLWLYQPETNELRMRVPHISPSPRVAAGEGLVGECLSKREVINVSDAYNDPRFNTDVDMITGFKTESILSVPLLGRDQQPVGVMQLLNKHNGVFDFNDELVAKALAAQCALAVQRTQMTEALLLKERLDEEVALAREIQMSTLPSEMPDVPGYDLHGDFRPTDQTGGDLYDLVVLDGKLFILMGDATGHGFGPALSATQMQAMLRVAFRSFGRSGPILHYKAKESECSWLDPTSYPVGILEMDKVGDPHTIRMEHGDILALLSDGIFEYENRQGVQLGEERVGQLVERFNHLPMPELGKFLLDATFEHGGGVKQADDITLVLLKRLPGETGE